MAQINISIVIYDNDVNEIKKTIQSVLNTELDIRLYLIDNSPINNLKVLSTDRRIFYFFNNRNVGYGSAHNIGIKHSIEEGAKYHIVMNPDITFKDGTLENIYAFMESNRDVGSLMPKVYYEDGSLQRLCKLLPTPFDLIGRRFFGNTNWAKRQNESYELHNFDYNSILNTPCLSGCFMFVRTEVFEKSGLFDPRYFMYLEDYDLTRRIHGVAKTIFYPEVSVIHGHAKESYRNGKLLRIHMLSAVKYFNKWGWFFDNERKALNSKVLRSIEK
ncbi:glycosyltransferase [Pedobacter sp.]|jgi:GT2 family glycosyltransferase|uniref:glycosyltransferase n=1 Tax=Pedobacter sp. TaxID=1411316 RepID=UPI002BD91CCE|nr:glycosyltransferase [Pedobacter sp.]HWW41769.1 glycosyltransferase [Pedobacter sp.]